MRVEDVLAFADSIAWDECHKIYIQMDNVETLRMREYGYETYSVHDAADALATLKMWWAESCVLRFVTAIKSRGQDEEFTRIIEQGEEWK
mgnify:CR=1 FL=1